MVLSDAKVLMELLGTAGEWLRLAVQRAKKKRDRAAANVLHDAFVVVASMRAYDNAFRPLLGQLLVFSVRWDPEQRRRLSHDLNEFFDIEQIMPRFRQALTALQSASWEGAGAEALDQVIAAASKFSEEVAGSIYEEKQNYIERLEISNALLYSQYEEDEGRVQQWANDLVTTLDRQLLARADDGFGKVRREILAAHDLPDPGYAIAVG